MQLLIMIRKLNLKKQKSFAKLQKTISRITENNITILLGDSNAEIRKEKKFCKTVGLYSAHNRTNKNRGRSSM